MARRATRWRENRALNPGRQGLFAGSAREQPGTIDTVLGAIPLGRHLPPGELLRPE